MQFISLHAPADRLFLTDFEKTILYAGLFGIPESFCFDGIGWKCYNMVVQFEKCDSRREAAVLAKTMQLGSGSIFETAPENSGVGIRLTRANGAQAFIYHWHDAVEILYGLEGSTTVGVVDRPYTLSEGDILIIGSGESHCLFPADYRAKRLVLMFEPARLFGSTGFWEDRSCFSGIERHSSGWDAKTRQKIYQACMTIEQEYTRRLPGWQQQVVGQLMLMASDVIREVPKASVPADVQMDDGLRRVLGYLSEHFLEPVTLKDCAAALGFNPSYLSGMFSLRTGAPFHRYLLNLRLKKAEWLLVSGEMPVSEVALQSGFSSDKTFYRVFREQYGLSPGDYRKKQRRMSGEPTTIV